MNDALKRTPESQDIALEANQLQFKATIPEKTVWVAASAGSGKTKVLAERVLRLLLPDDARAGADPSKILCITFTKAAASEVLERIMKYLRFWAIKPEHDLEADLTKLLGHAPSAPQIQTARALFANVLEVAGGMKIMTIHAFCQSVLARFPMEAGLPAGFEVMEESQAKTLLTAVRHNIITNIQNSDHKLQKAFEYLASIKNADDIEQLMATMASERGRLNKIRKKYGTTDHICAEIYKTLGLQENDNEQKLIDNFIKHIPENQLRSILPLLETDNKTNQGYFKKLAEFLSSHNKSNLFETYQSVFLTNEKEPRKLTGNAKQNNAIINLFSTESGRLQRLDSTRRNLATAQGTTALLRFAIASLDQYEAIKHAHNKLDYEDLIDRTRGLLSAGGVHWVQYKLDGGIDHILVDEAQDTNPDQWDIITAIYDEFYDGASAREPLNRTTFVVGDEKQSIFSFQRADIAVFDSMRTRLETRSYTNYTDIPMRISFRSAPSILKTVDTVFNSSDMKNGVLSNMQDHFEHQAFHSQKNGRVEIWPLIEKEKKQEQGQWQLPEITDTTQSPITRIAKKTAEKISDMLQNDILESKNRRVMAGDIMILLSKRKPMADAILKALREKNIPVGGIDRMVVSQQLAVMDVLSTLEFMLQPDDDLNLATLLKSPLINLNEDALYQICHTRENTVWNALKNEKNHDTITTWLSALLEISGKYSVSHTLHHILYKPCPANAHNGISALISRLGADIRDPLQELLARADTHDMQHSSGLQGFVQAIKNDDSEIKRQMQEGDNRVRIMTVHGSKGLEAPIVFMPDTIRTNNSANKTESILWPARDDDNDLPLWAPNSESRADLYEDRVSTARVNADAEYKRLLYVAMTRAGERLYIGGAQKSDAKYIDQTKSWYFRIQSALTPGQMPELEIQPDGTKIITDKNPQPQTQTPDEKAEIKTDSITIPKWAREQTKTPEFPPRPLAPSKPEAQDPAAISPLFGSTAHRFKRGNIIHTLFQFLPDLPETERHKKANAWLSQKAHGLNVEEKNEILDAVFNVLNNPVFASIFTAQARAEVPLTGLLNAHTIVSGQIDRLLVTDEAIMVIDYKTNRPAPKTKALVPEAYKNQMRTYRDVLSKIWPDKPIHCALLWTDGPDLMDITDIL